MVCFMGSIDSKYAGVLSDFKNLHVIYMYSFVAMQADYLCQVFHFITWHIFLQQPILFIEVEGGVNW